MNFHFIKTYLWLFSLKILKNCLEKVELGFGFNTRYTYKILMRRFTHFYILHHWILIFQGGCALIYFFLHIRRRKLSLHVVYLSF